MSFASFDGHQAHDSALLARRWAALARRAGLRWRRLLVAGDFPVHYAESRAALRGGAATVYLSAGVHGDEAAAPWGLLAWAETSVALLAARPFLIFPCLNPHGLARNTRVDQRGVDLNRMFHDGSDPLVAAWRGAVGGRALSLALCLHEDYDAQGCYLYELTHKRDALGPRILRDCATLIPPDRRSRIDGRRARGGVIIRRVPPVLAGLPEAIALHQLGVPVTLTFESPSEHSLLDRIAVQRRFIQSALRHELGI